MSFPHIALIFLVALIVLGPQKMPKLVAQVGRWAGKARAMARQFREQLETEINLEELNKNASAKTPPPDQFHPPYGHEAPATADSATTTADASTATADATPADASPADATVPTDATHPAVAQSMPAGDAGGDAAVTSDAPAAAEAAPVATAWVPDVHDGSQFEPAAPETIRPTPMVGNHERV